MPVEVYTRRKTDMEILRETAIGTRRKEEEEHGLGFNHPPVQRRKRPVLRKCKPQIDTSDLSTVLLVKGVFSSHPKIFHPITSNV
jgi:hypothetical protein